MHYRAKSGASVHAVKGLDLDVAPGEIVGFLGPNGAGKSSTLKALMGFVQPTSGECSIFGKSAGTEDSRVDVGYLPEVAMYYPFLTPVETLQLYGELQGLRGKPLFAEINQLLELVGLAHAKKKLNRQLSKGMLQRVGIAQSLLGNPKLLVLDEVTSGLDPIGRRELRNLLLQKREEGATLFFSSHELSEVSMICDRILMIHKGVLVEERDLPELQSSIGKFELVFTGNCAIFDLATNLETQESGATKAYFATKSALLEAIDRVRNVGGNVIDFTAQEGSLEDYFITTIERQDGQGVAA